MFKVSFLRSSPYQSSSITSILPLAGRAFAFWIVFCPMRYPRFLVPIGVTLFTGRPHGSKKRRSCAILRWSLSYRGTQTPIVSQITFRESKGEAYSSISSSVRFYEASKHSSLTLINQEVCRHSLRLPVVSYTSCILSHASYLLFLLKVR